MAHHAMYPADLKKEIIQVFHGLDERNRPYEFPPDSFLEGMLEATFFASLQREESRQLEFRLGYCSPNHLVDMSRLAPGVHWAPFETPRKCCDAELRRLSPAIDASKSMLCCHGSNELKITGILTASSDFSRMSTRSVLSGRMLPDVFNISTTTPGELCANRGDACFVQLRNGKLRFPFNLQPLLRHLVHIENAMEADAWDSVPEELRAAKGSTRVMSPYFPFLAHLLYTMDRGRHGGSLLIVPQNRAESLGDDIIRIKYKLRNISAWTICRNWLAQLIKSNGSKPQTRFSDQSRGGSFESVNEQYKFAMQLAEFLGGLGRVDGAVVMTESLDTIGFGAEITSHAEHVKDVRYYADTRTPCQVEPVDANGTRHRSVIRFCNAIEGATGFVLSQDGGMKVVRRGTEGVEMWGDVVPTL
jgi:hypothetical protein